jgi:hypothetical protein
VISSNGQPSGRAPGTSHPPHLRRRRRSEDEVIAGGGSAADRIPELLNGHAAERILDVLHESLRQGRIG